MLDRVKSLENSGMNFHCCERMLYYSSVREAQSGRNAEGGRRSVVVTFQERYIIFLPTSLSLFWPLYEHRPRAGIGGGQSCALNRRRCGSPNGSETVAVGMSPLDCRQTATSSPRIRLPGLWQNKKSLLLLFRRTRSLCGVSQTAKSFALAYRQDCGINNTAT